MPPSSPASPPTPTMSTRSGRRSAHFSQFAQDAVYPYGAGGPNCELRVSHRALHARSFGATREDFGRLCVAQRENALRYPHALFKKPLTLEQYLDARPVAEPLHLFDCVMPCAGAEAFLVMRETRAAELGRAAAPMSLATIERHNAFPDDPVQLRGGWALRSRGAIRAGRRPSRDIDFLQTYDDYPVISFMQLEDLGFCGKGEAPQFVRDHTLHDRRRRFHTTPRGGQLSAGQAGAAGGFLGMVEAIRQLTGQRSARGARCACRAGQRFRHDQLRSRHLVWGCDSRGGQRMSTTTGTAAATLLPPAARSRVALGLTAAAALGRFELQTCLECGAVQYPPREACHRCLSVKLQWRQQPYTGELLARTILFHSNEPYFRERFHIDRTRPARLRPQRCRVICKAAP